MRTAVENPYTQNVHSAALQEPPQSVCSTAFTPVNLNNLPAAVVTRNQPTVWVIIVRSLPVVDAPPSVADFAPAPLMVRLLDGLILNPLDQVQLPAGIVMISPSAGV